MLCKPLPQYRTVAVQMHFSCPVTGNQIMLQSIKHAAQVHTSELQDILREHFTFLDLIFYLLQINHLNHV